MMRSGAAHVVHGHHRRDASGADAKDPVCGMQGAGFAVNRSLSFGAVGNASSLFLAVSFAFCVAGDL
jgi:hypothetical protein